MYWYDIKPSFWEILKHVLWIHSDYCAIEKDGGLKMFGQQFICSVCRRVRS